MVDVAVENFGGMNVAFNNAGTFMVGIFAGVTEDSTNKMLDVNFKSLVYSVNISCSLLAIRGLHARPRVFASAVSPRNTCS